MLLLMGRRFLFDVRIRGGSLWKVIMAVWGEKMGRK
jgi:hypothetical protein